MSEKRIIRTGTMAEIGRLPVDQAIKDAANEAAERAHQTLRGYMASALERQLAQDGYLID